MSELSELTPQEKKANRKKDIIKDIAIAFLAIMLLLTFFSNTIMNYSLPQVATQEITNGKISPQIRGTGTVEASDPYSVKVTETRVVKSVAVSENTHVEKGDVIYYLEDQESTELTEAQTKLDELELAYQQALFAGDVDNETITSIRNGDSPTMDQYQAMLNAATERYEAAQDADNAAQAVIDNLTAQQSIDDAENAYNQATPEYGSAQATYDLTIVSASLETISTSISTLESDLSEAETNLANSTKGTSAYKKYKKQIKTLESQIASAEAEKSSLESQENSLNEIINTATKDQAQISTYTGQLDNVYSQKLAEANLAKERTALELTNASNDKDDILKTINAELSLVNQRDEIEKQQEVVDKLIEDSTGATITAPVTGTITSLACTAGESTSSEEAVAVIQVDGKAMTTSFSVTNEQAAKLKVGAIAQPQDAWYYTDFKATLKSISADSSEPNSKKVLKFEIESTEVTNGQTISLVIGESSVDYDLVVPNGAIREDTNGKFILIIRSKSSPLSTRYIATRVDVEVLASDDTNSAISGSLEGYEYVITTSSSPIEAGQQVRLANS
ncbi:MAG: biotin/lipoyl-binding protein [Butyrivibrio sp.]|nr:biotin/lipoyl-binding protein [Butyrivibrio sp.]